MVSQISHSPAPKRRNQSLLHFPPFKSERKNISPCENPNNHGELRYKQTAPKTEPSIKSECLNIERCFLKPLNLSVRPVSGTNVEPWSETFMWNLHAESLCEALIRKLHDKPFCETFTYIRMWNLSLELWNLFLWNLRTCKSGTFITHRLGRSERGDRHAALSHGWTEQEEWGTIPRPKTAPEAHPKRTIGAQYRTKAM